MTIEKKLDGTSLTITLEGRLDTNTAPLLEAELKQKRREDSLSANFFNFHLPNVLSSSKTQIIPLCASKPKTKKYMFRLPTA